MNDEGRDKIVDNAITVIYFIVALIVCYMLGSCKSIEYVPVETVREINNEHYHDRVITDTVKEHTNTVVRQMSAEDSVFLASLGLKVDAMNKLLLIDRNTIREQKNSVQDITKDSLSDNKVIKVPYPVERKLSKWEQFKNDYAGYIALIALALVAVLQYIFIKHIRQKK